VYKQTSLILSVILLSGLFTSVPSHVQAQVLVAQKRSPELKELLEEGRKLVDARDYDGAISVYQRAASIEPKNPRIHSAIGYLQAQKGNFRAALDAYRKAIALNPNNGDFFYAVAFIHGNLGDMKSSKEAYRKSIQLNRTNVNAYIGLGVTQSRLGDSEAAMWAYEQAINIDRSNPLPYEMIGAIFKQKGKRTEANKLLKKSRDLYERRQDWDGVARTEGLLKDIQG
jgi:Flp pilus assembly protein TadD